MKSSAFAAALAVSAGLASSEQLPLKTYSTADGLPSDRIQAVLSDSRGFLWLATADGISRFDGYGFTNLTVSDGLPDASVHALIESRDGSFWAGTSRGLAHWDPRAAAAPRASLRVIHLPGGGHSDDAQALLEDRAGRIWVGTEDGLFRIAKGGIERVPLGERETPSVGFINALVEDREGALWVGTQGGLYRRSPSGKTEPAAAPGGPPGEVRCLLEDRGGSLWVGTQGRGLFVVRRTDADRTGALRPAFSRENGLPGDHVTALFERSDGKIWAACYGGLAEISADRSSIRTYTTAQGLSGLGLWSLGEDRYRDLWIGSDDAGLMRLAGNGFRRFDARDGLKSIRIGALFENAGGEPCAFTRGRRPEEIAGEDGFLECFDGKAFRARRPGLPRGTLYGWGWAQFTFQDHAGEWWIPTLSGLYRFPSVPFARLDGVPPRSVYTTRTGLPSDLLFRLFEDSRGDLWIGLLGEERQLVSWDRATDSFRVFSGEDGIPARQPMSFAEDRHGAVWIGFLRGGLARYRQGRLSYFTESEGLPSGSIRALLSDHAGRMWIASSAGGVARVDRPEDSRPTFRPVGRAQGLSSVNAWSLAEDRRGRVYVGTERGLDRIDPATGNVQHFTTDDGLALGVIESMLVDRKGNIWFGSSEGLSWLEPVAESPKIPPAVRIRAVSRGGARQPLPEIGAEAVALPGGGPEGAPLQIEFAGIDFAPGGRLRYEYRLDGIDRDWSAPSDQRSVVYARLPAGAYRFRVRAVANDGSVGAGGAEVRFTVLPPLWRRPEILALLFVGLGAAAYALHRIRLERALEVERVRTRVARDLHDDIGAGLSEIAILSEVVRGGARDQTPLLAEIGDRARGLVDSMSDIVWSTDPRKDDVSSLVQRIRRFGANALESRGIFWSLEVPEDFEARRLDPDQRRQIFLIVKEALTNVARHSRCTRAAVRILPAADAISVEIEDDGSGFSTSEAECASGHGLANMKGRAAAVRGELQLDSRPSGGTRIRLRVPLRRSRAPLSA